MIKAAHLSLGLYLALVPAPALLAQAESSAPDLSIANTEAVMRQANRIKLREKLTAAAATQQRRDLATAARPMLSRPRTRWPYHPRRVVTKPG